MIVLSGATGKIGTLIMHQLADRRTPFRAVVRAPSRLPADIPKSAYEVTAADLLDLQSYAAALEGASALFLLSLESDALVAAVGEIMKLAREAGVGRVVLLSARADINSHIPFLRWHGEIEKFVSESGIAFDIFRPDWFMQNFFDTAKGGEIRQPAGRGKRCFIDTQDVASVAVELLMRAQAKQQIYLLSGPESLGFEDAARILREETGKPFRYTAVPPQDYRRFMIENGSDPAFADMFIDLTLDMRNEVPTPVRDTFEKLTGRKLKRFRDFVREEREKFIEIFSQTEAPLPT